MSYCRNCFLCGGTCAGDPDLEDSWLHCPEFLSIANAPKICDDDCPIVRGSISNNDPCPGCYNNADERLWMMAHFTQFLGESEIRF